MPYVLYDYADHKGNRIKEWAKWQPKIQLHKLNQRLDRLQYQAYDDPDLIPGLLDPAGHHGIWKIKVQGNPKLRPMLCKGPLNNDAEFTLLVGAVETQSVLTPGVEVAVDRRQQILNTRNMRVAHERFKGKAG